MDWALFALLVNLDVHNILASFGTIEQIHKSYNAPVPYPAQHHSDQKCAHLSNISAVNCTLWDMGRMIAGFVDLVFWDNVTWSGKAHSKSLITSELLE